MKILYFQHDTSLGGAAWALYQIVADMIRQHDVVVVVSSEGPLVSELRQLGAKVIVCKALTTICNPPSFVRWCKTARWLIDVIRWERASNAACHVCLDERPDIVHINTMVLFHLACGVKKAGNIPVLLHVREHWHALHIDPRHTIIRSAFKCIDHVFSITTANATQFGYPGPTTIVHDWADFVGREGEGLPDRRCGISGGRKIFLLPGGRLKHKGTLIAIRAMHFVQNSDAVFLVLGGTGRLGGSFLDRLCGSICPLIGILPYSKRVCREAEQLGTGRVVLAPLTKNMLPVMQESYAVVSPFIEPHFSKPVVEAGFLQKPVIASDYEEIREAVKDGETGMLVPPRDVHRLAEAIDWLAANPDEACKMGDRAKVWVDDAFSKQESLQKIRAVYESI